MQTRHTLALTLSPCFGFALCAGLLALPFSTLAVTGSGIGGETECVRFQAGREVKSGECFVSISATGEYHVNFADEEEETTGMDYACPGRSNLPNEKIPNCTPPIVRAKGSHSPCSAADQLPGETCALTLDGKPAVPAESPQKPTPEWFCLEQSCGNTALCMKKLVF